MLQVDVHPHPPKLNLPSHAPTKAYSDTTWCGHTPIRLRTTHGPTHLSRTHQGEWRRSLVWPHQRFGLQLIPGEPCLHTPQPTFGANNPHPTTRTSMLRRTPKVRTRSYHDTQTRPPTHTHACANPQAARHLMTTRHRPLGSTHSDLAPDSWSEWSNELPSW